MDAWDDFVARYDALLTRSHRDSDTKFEHEFVTRVLRKVPGLAPSMVRPQHEVKLPTGRYFMDFAIEEDSSLRLCVEVDGFDKRGRGAGATPLEFRLQHEREADIAALGWDVVRVPNGSFMQDPDRWVRHLELLIRRRRDLAALTMQERSELERLMRQAEADHLGARQERERAAIETQNTLVAAAKAGQAQARAEEQAVRAARAARAAEEASKRAAQKAFPVLMVLLGSLAVPALLVSALLLLSTGRGQTPPSATPTLAGPANLPTITPPQPGVNPVNKACPASYPIKGNIALRTASPTPTRERIYHVPGGAFYSTTEPERCFATERDAVAEDYRRAQR